MADNRETCRHFSSVYEGNGSGLRQYRSVAMFDNSVFYSTGARKMEEPSIRPHCVASHKATDNILTALRTSHSSSSFVETLCNRNKNLRISKLSHE
jgi:hypothetical protein